MADRTFLVDITRRCFYHRPEELLAAVSTLEYTRRDDLARGLGEMEVGSRYLKLADRLERHGVTDRWFTLLGRLRPDLRSEIQEAERRYLDLVAAPATAQEKLLFGDDLTVDMAVVRMILRVADSVCRLTVTAAGSTSLGSGFRIGPGLVLTNHHVLRPNGNTPQAVLLEFNHELRTGDTSAKGIEAIQGNVESIVTEEGDDWAVVELREAPIGDWPILPLPEVIQVAVGDAAYVVQHPVGLPKRAGLVRNRIELVQPERVHYLTDTQQGSSGSPVFDWRGTLIALHHAGGTLPLPGRAGTKVWANEGINIVQVRRRLLANGVRFDGEGAHLR